MPKVKKEDKINEDIKNLNIDKKAIVNEIKKEVQNQISEEIIKKVDYETKNKIDKMEKRIYKYKNISIIKRNIIIILFLAIIIFETKILYDNDLLHLSNNKKIEENNIIETKKESEEQDEVKDTKWYIDNYSYLLDNVKTDLTGEDTYYLYKKNYTETSIRNSVRLNMSYQLLNKEDITIENSVVTIKESDLKESYKKIFGSLDNYKSENFNNNCIQFIYNKDSKSYMAIDTVCEESNEELLEEIKTIYEEDNKIVIETIVGIKDNKELNNIDGTKVTDNYSGNISEFEDKLNKYQYIFEKTDNNYYLKEINKLNKE